MKMAKNDLPIAFSTVATLKNLLPVPGRLWDAKLPSWQSHPVVEEAETGWENVRC